MTYFMAFITKLIIILGNTIPLTSTFITKIITVLELDLKLKTITTVVIV